MVKIKVKCWYAAGLDEWVAQYSIVSNGKEEKSETFAAEWKEDAIKSAASDLLAKHGVQDYELIEE